EIDRAVAVIVGRAGVVVDGSNPDGRDTEIFEVLQVIDYSLQIAAVISARLAAIVKARRLRRIIVCRISVGKSIDHYQIDDVVGCKSLVFPGRIRKRKQSEIRLRRALRSFYVKDGPSRRRSLRINCKIGD